MRQARRGVGVLDKGSAPKVRIDRTLCRYRGRGRGSWGCGDSGKGGRRRAEVGGGCSSPTGLEHGALDENGTIKEAARAHEKATHAHRRQENAVQRTARVQARDGEGYGNGLRENARARCQAAGRTATSAGDAAAARSATTGVHAATALLSSTARKKAGGEPYCVNYVLFSHRAADTNALNDSVISECPPPASTACFALVPSCGVLTGYLSCPSLDANAKLFLDPEQAALTLNPDQPPQASAGRESGRREHVERSFS